MRARLFHRRSPTASKTAMIALRMHYLPIQSNASAAPQEPLGLPVHAKQRRRATMASRAPG
jgi:hypothetical protein